MARRDFQSNLNSIVDQRTGFWVVFAGIGGFLLLVALVLPAWIYGQLSKLDEQADLAAAPRDTAFVDYSISPRDYLRDESSTKMDEYTKQFPQPQNVQVLKGLSTTEISTYMVRHVSGGLKVDCTYCHNINNFSEDALPTKATARSMMLMSADLNQNYIAQLPASVGNYQITCATCHNGKPVYATYPLEIQNTLPNDYQLPLELDYPGGLVVNGRLDKSLSDVELNQYTMYHMNVSLGQGCTFCHNARYFPSNEIEQKNHTIIMLQMSKHLWETYEPILNNRYPSCWQCHQRARIPPASAVGDPAQSGVPSMLAAKP